MNKNPDSPKSSDNSTCAAACSHDREQPEGDLLQPFQLRGLTLRNRIVMSPMCQYSSNDGYANDWHLVHLGSRAAGGVGLVMVEATAVTPAGRITPGDLGLWSDEHGEMLARIARFVRSQGAAVGIQLAHAGRKASCALPWDGGAPLPADAGGWQPIFGASPVPFSPAHQVPAALSEAAIDDVVKAFVAAAKRAIKAGFQLLEIHAAHGYLLHSFLSPLSNKRQDQYGGSLVNRQRFTVQVATAVRQVMPAEMPLLVRISGTDWVEGGWDIEQSVLLAKALKDCGVDLIDVSSGGNVPKANIPVGPGYQVPLAQRVRDEAKIAVGAVGMITEAHAANSVVTSGQADLVFLARELLRTPYWALQAETQLDQAAHWPTPYGYAIKRR